MKKKQNKTTIFHTLNFNNLNFHNEKQFLLIFEKN